MGFPLSKKSTLVDAALREVQWVVTQLVSISANNFMWATPVTLCPATRDMVDERRSRSKWVSSPRLLRSQDLPGPEVAKMQMLGLLQFSASSTRRRGPS